MCPYQKQLVLLCTARLSFLGRDFKTSRPVLGQNEYLLDASLLSRDSVWYCRWWRDGNIILALVGAAIMALIFNFQDELAPLFVSAPKKEVLSLSICHLRSL